MKTLLAWLLYVQGAWAASTVQLVMPRYYATNAVIASGVANELRCARIVAPFSVTGVTHLTGGIVVAGGTATTGLAIYTDTDDTGSSHVLCRITNNPSAVGPITGACSSFNITALTIYRLCMCSTSTGTKPLTSFEFAVAGGDNNPDLLNAFTAHAGVAAQTCTSGTPPTATGVISTGTALTGIPIMVFE